ncbi:MAG: AAA family ATPase, partial [Acidobacteria bacterium]|nr:AAA family ATPase [Acidobacteriota bacterium]
MVIELPGEITQTRQEALTPKRTVEELDRYIVGQNDAKRAVSVALRNRWRRQQLAPELREEIAPKNIIMIGPTGVGKTEIARRLAKLTASPFLKIEASKFTEVGYVGRDVESIVRDLMELGIQMVREEKEKHVRKQAEHAARERLLDLLLPSPVTARRPAFVGSTEPETGEEDHRSETREKIGKLLDDGRLEDREVEVEVKVDAAELSRLTPRTHPLWWGVAGAVAIEAAVVANLLTSYFYLMAQNDDWPPEGVD